MKKNNKRPNKKLKRVPIESMISYFNVMIENIAIVEYAENRNPEMVPDELWEEILDLHCEEIIYN